MDSAKKIVTALLGLTLVVVIVGGGVWAYQQQQINELEKEIISLKSQQENSASQKNNASFDELSASSRDTERETDIKALQGQIEAYYAMNGYYPTLENINSSSFRSANMKGLDDEALRDPAGQKAQLSNKPGKGVYSYEALPEDCNQDCVSYTLTATYEDGSVYTKVSLN